tara:strand:+ start:457 stop:792 length:336 start_codon:yes stop_codon:yes gene_type:complete
MRRNNKRRNYSNKNNKEKKISGCLEVKLDKYGKMTPEILVKKFIKKAKKEGIVEEYKSRRYYKPPSEKKREKKRQTERLLEKVKQKEKELFNFADKGRKIPSRKKKRETER